MADTASMGNRRNGLSRAWKAVYGSIRDALRSEPAHAVWDAANGAMPYREFFARFGGGARTKNLKKVGLRRGFLPTHPGLPKNLIRLDPWEMEFLYGVARRARSGIVEIGRFKGGSTFLLACANPNVPIYSIDLAPKDDQALGRLFEQHAVGGNVTLMVGDSQRGKFDAVKAYDVLFIDGDHTRAGCAADIENWYGALSPGGYIMFHDSYLDGEGVQDAVLDFVERHDGLQIIAAPLIGASYWRHPAGSMACLRKPSSSERAIAPA